MNKNKKQGFKQAKPKKKNKTLRYVPIKDSNVRRQMVVDNEMTQGFEDLVSWVKDGVSPLGDDLLDPDVVADPNFGCNFTSEDRVWPFPLTIPACPE